MEENIVQGQPEEIKNSSAGAWPKVALFSVLGLVLVGGLVFAALKIGVPTKPQQKACSAEAKICPDGSAVGRTGPNCEFAPCPAPATKDETASWKVYTSTKHKITFKYPASWYTLSEDLKIMDGTVVVSFSTSDPKLGGNLSGIEIVSYSNPRRLQLIDWWRKQIGEGEYANEVESKYLFKTTINSLPALRQEPDSAPENLEMTDIFVARDGTVFKIRATNDIVNQDVNKEIFNLILYALKFLD